MKKKKVKFSDRQDMKYNRSLLPLLKVISR